MTRVFLHPHADGEDDGQGGIRRVLEGMQRHLPAHGIELVDRPAAADVIACHIHIPDEWLRSYPEKVFVLHCHGAYWAEYEWGKWQIEANDMVIRAARVADAITSPSEWLAQTLRRNLSRPIDVIPHGLELDEWAAGQDGGYILWDKTRPDPVCDPKPMNALATMLPRQQFVATFGEPAHNVRIVGHLPFAEAKALTQNASLYLATTKETFGVATLQALACGVPVVGYAAGANAEIVTNGEHGVLVDPHGPNPAGALAEAATWAQAHRAELAPKCRARAEEFRWARACAMYADLYRRVAAKNTEPRPRTSIIVRAYNLDAYLPETLASVQAQSDQNWECIVVDDASPDRCGEIAEEFAAHDERFRVVHNEQNLFISGAANEGIKAARGKYITLLDADDLLPVDAIATLAGALDVDRTAGAVYGNVRFVKDDGRTPMIYDPRESPGHSGWPFPFNWEWQMLGSNLLPYSSMYRREAWEQTGGYRRRLRNAEDADFWARISSYGWQPKKITDADMLIYRVREHSISKASAVPDWKVWFPWADDAQRSPGGAVAEATLPIPSFDPPAISVVIPVGPGHESIVADAVDSVEAQTFRWFECIVVNDSGRDLEPLPAWVKVIDNHGPRGVASARNAGIAASRAKYFIPLDADDMLEPNALDVWWQAAKGRPNTAFYSDFWEDPWEEGRFTRFETPDWDARKLLGMGAIHAVTAMIPRAWWDAVGGYDEELSAWEDWAFMLACAEKGFCSARVASPLFTYRKHAGMRRELNLAAGEESRDAIRSRFGRYWEDGGPELMGCGCSQSQTSTIGGVVATPPPTDGNLALVLYEGPAIANIEYRAPSGQRYTFAAGLSLYVYEADLTWFTSKPGFRQLEQTPVGSDAAPILV